MYFLPSLLTNLSKNQQKLDKNNFNAALDNYNSQIFEASESLIFESVCTQNYKGKNKKSEIMKK